MSTPGNAPAIRGTVETDEYMSPTAMTSAHSNAVHGVANVLRDMLHRIPVYHAESDLNAALTAIGSFEKALVNPSDRQGIVGEDDYAPREDVSQRTPPNPYGITTLPAQSAPIDYDKLAAAIVSRQQQLMAQHEAQVAQQAQQPPQGFTPTPPPSQPFTGTGAQ